MADIQDLVADAIAAQLNAVDWGLPIEWTLDFLIERSYVDWTEALSAPTAEKLKIDLFPGETFASDLICEDSIQYEYPFFCVIRKSLGASDQEPNTGRIATEEKDLLVKLLRDMGKHLQSNRRPLTYENAMQQGPIQHSFSRKKLEAERQFVGMLRAMYQIPDLLD